MSAKHALLVVEGPTDQAVVGRSLRKLLSFEEFRGGLKDLDPFWRDVAHVVPTYPPQHGPLYERLAMPSILRTAAWSIAVYAGGGSKLVEQVSAIVHNHDLQEKLDAFGVIADSDRKSPAAVAEHYRRAFEGHFAGLSDRPGEVVAGPPAVGIFVLPDNQRQGVVEHLVLECGEIAYPDLLERARHYVAGFTRAERQGERWAPFDEEKATIAAVASLLKPGKTNTASLADNAWISETTRVSPMLGSLVRFLAALLGLQATPGDGR